MMTCIIVSNAKTPVLKRMTEVAINSCGCEQVIIVESAKVDYKGATTIRYTSDVFNYNRALNMGIEYAKHDYIALCNNDIYFYPNFNHIEQVMRTNNIMSASPYTLNFKLPVKAGAHLLPGYEIRKQLLGWCIVVKKELLDAIGGLDETFDFWYSDNAYAEQIKSIKVPHFLVCNVFIDHYESKTLSTLEYTKQKRLTIDEAKKWQKRIHV
jgi:GT2 family glycosyltransferase